MLDVRTYMLPEKPELLTNMQTHKPTFTVAKEQLPAAK